MANYIFSTVPAPIVSSETVIDGHLSDEDVEVLYKRWKSDWPTPLEFPGGVIGITCEGILQVPVSTLNRVYGKMRGQRIRNAAEVNANA